MKLKIINLIISREYQTRVRKKTFRMMTIVDHIFMSAVCLVDSLY